MRCAISPRLRGCALIPVRLAMAAEQHTRKKRLKLPSKPRSAIRKFTPVESGAAADIQFYDGREVAQGSDEARSKKAISRDGRSQRYAMNQLMSLSPGSGSDSLGEFCMYLAYLTAAYPDISMGWRGGGRAGEAGLLGPFDIF